MRRLYIRTNEGLLGLSATYALVDVYHFFSGAPLSYLGMNSILVYCAHGILHRYFPFRSHLTPIRATLMSLIYSLIVYLQ